MSNQRLLEELQTAHDEYLSILMNYLSPEERKPLAEKSMQEFKDLMERLASPEASIDQINQATAIIKHAGNSLKFPKGGCTVDCLANMVRVQQQVLVHATKRGLPPEAVLGLGELCNQFVTDCLAHLLIIANSEDRPWQTKDKSHNIIQSTIQVMTQILDTLKAGKVLAVKLPNVSTADVKQFMN